MTALQVLAQIGVASCDPARVRSCNDIDHINPDGDVVVYWMMRSQRGTNNLALDTAIACARSLNAPLVVLVRMAGGPHGNDLRHVDVMLRALPEVAAECADRQAHVVLDAWSGIAASAAVQLLNPKLVILDDDVMPKSRATRTSVSATLAVPCIAVDGDLIVPSGMFDRQEYGARTIRPKIHRLMYRFEHELGGTQPAPRLPVPKEVIQRVHSCSQLTWFDPSTRTFPHSPHAVLLRRAGEAGIADRAGRIPAHDAGPSAATRALEAFVANALHGYAGARNHPEVDGTSRLSVHLHFGHISPHVIVQHVKGSGAPAIDSDAFVEQLVVRRELAHNFVAHNPHSHRLEGAASWAQATLAEHADDVRANLYSEEELTEAATHDPLWNAAQRQMVTTGLMHGYLRMYWAKKILEWSPTPSRAFDVALQLNDRYSLDGRDPNGIAGVAWAVAGVHDRPWPRRPVFGAIRYMSLASTGRKFNSARYIERWTP